MTHPTDIRGRFPQASASFLARNPQLSTTAKTKTTPVKSKTTTTEQAEHDPHDVTGSMHASKPRIRQDRGGLNRTEAEFKAYIEQYGSTAVREAVGLRLANGCVYWPDFVILDSIVRCYEVKGFMRDDACIKLKVAASKFPTFKFFLVTKQSKKAGGGWDIQEVLS